MIRKGTRIQNPSGGYLEFNRDIQFGEARKSEQVTAIGCRQPQKGEAIPKWVDDWNMDRQRRMARSLAGRVPQTTD